ncbi:hypothetical protein JZ751_023667 [Albula glossodonta]|uniref:Collagen alpha-3(VI) chain n=1 Tax=Albula glossodonta TaxID=121402 RepID=A0A8T2NGL0_9TELE|nr:hypothetical protein JZ751_023667 [Albula glossodonta]
MAKRDVVFLLDGSEGTKRGFPAMRDFVQRVVEKLNVEKDKDRVSVVQYSRDAEANFYLNTYSTKADVNNTIRRLSHKGGRLLRTGAALQFVKDNVFTASAGSRRLEGVPQILILLSGGRSYDNVDAPASALKELGVQSLAIAETQGPKKDVIFLLDGSDATRREFPTIQEFVRRVVENLNVGENRIRIGVVQYSDAPSADIYLNSHTTKEGVLNAIKGLRHRGGRQRNLGRAIQFVSQDALIPARGGRKPEGVPQFVIAVSGGRSSDDVRGPATALKQSGVVPFSIGTVDVDSQELQVVSYVPNFSYSIRDFPGLYTIQENLISSLTELSNEEISRMQPQYPTVPVTPRGDKRDVVFLVDGSTAVRSDFPSIRDMIGRVVEKLDVGLDGVRVSVVQYSDDPKVEFLLNEHSTKDEVRGAVRKIRNKGGNRLNTGRALDWVSKNIYQRSAGSRIEEGVPQFLVLITGGQSSDDVSGPANQLKLTRVAPFAIGAKNANADELRLISLKPEYTFTVRDFQDLPVIEQQLVAPISTLTTSDIPVPEVIGHAHLGRKDIIFLIDGSSSVGTTGIAHIRDFILNVLQQLDIRPDQVRVGVVQYSDKQQTEFSLNSHNNKAAVISAVKRLRLMGGRSANLAEAIEYVIRNELKPSAGVRLAEASQHLVVLTGGRSPTDVSVYGPLLKGARVNCIGIGAGAADSRQLTQIATTSEDVLQVTSFPALPGIQDRFIARLNGTIVEEPTIITEDPSLPKPKTADIVFLVDGSINLGRDNFREVMDFILNLIDLFFTERDNLQIGLAHYATDVTDVFYLNTYKNKDDIISAISSTEYKGGRMINTGNGIKHVQANHFIKERGSRKDEGVPQILMIVTGGRSQDDGKSAALGLKATGVRIYAVGVGDIEDELNNLGSEATTVARASTFQELSELNEQILETLDDEVKGIKLCTGAQEPAKVCKLEVLVGFDVSAQNIFGAQRALESKMGAILQRIAQMQSISCSPGQAPTVQIGMLAMDSASEPVQLDFTENHNQLFEAFKALRNRGPYVLNAKTIDAYTAAFRSRGSDVVKVVIHLTDGLDGQYAQMKERVETLRVSGVNGFILVGLERVPRFEDAVLLEFGRGFRYTKPLRVNLLDLDYELLEELKESAVLSLASASATEEIEDLLELLDPRAHLEVRATEDIQEMKVVLAPEDTLGKRENLEKLVWMELMEKRGQVEWQDLQEIEETQEEGVLKVLRARLEIEGQMVLGETLEKQAWTDRKAALESQAGGVLMGEEAPLDNLDNLESQVLMALGESQALEGLGAQLDQLELQESEGKMGTLDQEGLEDLKELLEIKVEEDLLAARVKMVEMALEYLDPKEEKVTKDSQDSLDLRARLVTQAPMVAQGPEETEDRGVLLEILALLVRKEMLDTLDLMALKDQEDPQCDLVKKIRDNCRAQECPLYPTELAFALDVSEDAIRGPTFDNMRETVLRLLRDTTISESNCPRGARVALTMYNQDVTTEIRFADALKKKALQQRIEGLQARKNQKSRSLETAMRFLAQNTFKRVRSGFLMRKVAVFFVNGPVKSSPALSAAALQLYDAGIAAVFLTKSDDRTLTRALQANNTALGQVITLPSPGSGNYNSVIDKIMNCHICLDFCAPNQVCDYVPPQSSRDKRSFATDVDIDVAFVMDSSESTWPGVFMEMKHYISHIIDQLQIASDPKTSVHHARVAVVQHSPYEFHHNGSGIPVQVDIGLTDHGSKDDIKNYMQHKMVQLEGSLALGDAIEYTIENVFEKAPHPRDLKMIVLMVTGPVWEQDEERLVRIATEAKCKGYFLVILGVGERLGVTDGRILARMASEPANVFFKKIDGAAQFYDSYIQRFGLLLPKYISMENAFYMSPEVSKNCHWFQGDQPWKYPFRHSQKQEKHETHHVNQAVQPAKSKEPESEELHVANVTSNSMRLRWTSGDTKGVGQYEVTVTRLQDHSLALRKNVTGTELLLEGLESAQKYHVVVTRQTQGKPTHTFKGIISTKAAEKKIVTPPKVTATLSTAPLDKPELANENADPCTLDFDFGMPCKEYKAKWFFDKKNGICSQFWYGGCGGNANRFETEAQCMRRCLKTSPVPQNVVAQVQTSGQAGPPAPTAVNICQLPKEEGSCAKFVLKWHYDFLSSSCTRFWYGGCGGNQNRFDTKEECEKACVKPGQAPAKQGIIAAMKT